MQSSERQLLIVVGEHETAIMEVIGPPLSKFLVRTADLSNTDLQPLKPTSEPKRAKPAWTRGDKAVMWITIAIGVAMMVLYMTPYWR